MTLLSFSLPAVSWEKDHLFLSLAIFARSLLLSALILAPIALFLVSRSPHEAVQADSVYYLYLHVPAALCCLALYSLMSFCSLLSLIWRLKPAHWLCCATIKPCLLMAVMTLATGSLWGSVTWGTYWIWDARLTSFLFLTLFLCLLQLLQHLPRFSGSARGRKILASLILIGLADVFFVHQSVVWFKTLHQPPTFSLFKLPTMDWQFLLPLGVSSAVFFLAGFGLSFGHWVLTLESHFYPQKRSAR